MVPPPQLHRPAVRVGSGTKAVVRFWGMVP